MKILTEQQLEAFFKSVESDYDVFVPLRLHDGTRSLGKPGEGPLALAGGAIPQKITNVFFPQIETVLTIGPDGVKPQEAPAKPLFVVGFTAQDADCLEFIDRFYSENYRDDVYFNKRDGAVIVCVSGRCGADPALARGQAPPAKAGIILVTNADIRLWLPGDNLYDSAVNFPDDIAQGRYDLQIGILDERVDKPKVKLAIEGLQPDGWYNIGKIEVSL